MARGSIDTAALLLLGGLVVGCSSVTVHDSDAAAGGGGAGGAGQQSGQSSGQGGATPQGTTKPFWCSKAEGCVTEEHVYSTNVAQETLCGPNGFCIFVGGDDPSLQWTCSGSPAPGAEVVCPNLPGGLPPPSPELTYPAPPGQLYCDSLYGCVTEPMDGDPHPSCPAGATCHFFGDHWDCSIMYNEPVCANWE